MEMRSRISSELETAAYTMSTPQKESSLEQDKLSAKRESRSPSPSTKMKRLRVMTYCIFDDRNLAEIDYTAGLKKIIDIIQKYKPDILAIQKSTLFGDDDFNQDISETLRLSYFSSLKSLDEQKDIIILSRYKIQSSQ